VSFPVSGDYGGGRSLSEGERWKKKSLLIKRPVKGGVLIKHALVQDRFQDRREGWVKEGDSRGTAPRNSL